MARMTAGLRKDVVMTKEIEITDAHVNFLFAECDAIKLITEEMKIFKITQTFLAVPFDETNINEYMLLK